jgi:cellulose synthase/poly-beta-1,6-N-acetylglucosamine synthase-like glycosyltransferase
MSIHVGILTSSNIVRLKKCIQSCVSEFGPEAGVKLTVFINTLNKPFQESAVSLCQDEQLDYVITESNGTPARGKNTMVKWFSENTDDDYYIFVDGDDIIGKGFYERVSVHFYGGGCDIVTTEIPEIISTHAIVRVIPMASKVYWHYQNLLRKQKEYEVEALTRVIAVRRSSLNIIDYNEDLHTLEDAQFAFVLKNSNWGLNIRSIIQRMNYMCIHHLSMETLSSPQ